MGSVNDNLDGIKRHLIAFSFLEAESKALDGLISAATGGIFSLENYRPASPLMDLTAFDPASVVHIDLDESLKRIRDAVIMQHIGAWIDAWGSWNDQDTAIVKTEDLRMPQEAYSIITTNCFERLAGYMRDMEMPDDIDSVATLCFTPQLLSDVVAEGCANDAAEWILGDFKADFEKRLERSWRTITAYQEGESPSKVIALYLPEAFKSFAHKAANQMMDDLVSAFMALREWRDAGAALAQRQAWLEQYKRGETGLYDYGQNYAARPPSL